MQIKDECIACYKKTTTDNESNIIPSEDSTNKPKVL